MPKPTMIGSRLKKPLPDLNLDNEKTAIAIANRSMAMDTGAITLKESQFPQAQKILDSLDFFTLPSTDIVKIGFEAEQALQQTLDGFLQRLDQKTTAQIFALFGQLEKGVTDANLPEILQNVQSPPEPSWWGEKFGRFKGMSPTQTLQAVFNDVRDLVANKTRTLADEMARLEKDIQTELQKLYTELQTLDALKKKYGIHFNEFTVAAAIARAFLAKAKECVENEQLKIRDTTDLQEQARLQELQTKLQFLESRALALEGTYTRLPADQLVIQQIEQAGIATLQETMTTIASRFASIKMTLLTIHGAFAVKNVQQIADRQAAMDRQLTEIRGALLKDVTIRAAAIPGENRLAQAEQIEKIIVDFKEVNQLVAAARQETEQKFQQAREKFAMARQELANLS